MCPESHEYIKAFKKNLQMVTNAILSLSVVDALCPKGTAKLMYLTDRIQYLRDVNIHTVWEH